MWFLREFSWWSLSFSQNKVIHSTSPHFAAHLSPDQYFLLCFYRGHIFYGESTIDQEFSLEVPEISLLIQKVGQIFMMNI